MVISKGLSFRFLARLLKASYRFFGGDNLTVPCVRMCSKQKGNLMFKRVPGFLMLLKDTKKILTKKLKTATNGDEVLVKFFVISDFVDSIVSVHQKNYLCA